MSQALDVSTVDLVCVYSMGGGAASFVDQDLARGKHDSERERSKEARCRRKMPRWAQPPSEPSLPSPCRSGGRFSCRACLTGSYGSLCSVSQGSELGRALRRCSRCLRTTSSPSRRVWTSEGERHAFVRAWRGLLGHTTRSAQGSPWRLDMRKWFRARCIDLVGEETLAR